MGPLHQNLPPLPQTSSYATGDELKMYVNYKIHCQFVSKVTPD